MNLIPINSPRFIDPVKLASAPDWQMLFGNNNPLALEIGCGVGDFAVEMAALHPQWNYLALDYYNKGCLKTCKRADRACLDNILVIRDEARSFIERCIPRDSLQAVIINCPDPWPKMRHRKRRMVTAEFIGYLSGFMQPESDLYFATDFEDYGLDVAGFMPAIPGWQNVLVPNLYRHTLENYPLSKYMRKFMDEGKHIYFVHYRKVAPTGGDHAEKE